MLLRALVIGPLLTVGCLRVFDPLPQDLTDAATGAPDLEQSIVVNYLPPDLAGVDGMGTQSSGRDQFNATVRPIMEQRCAACHGMTGGLGPAFFKPDPYDNLTAYPGIITSDATYSLLITKGPHNGAAYFTDPEKLVVLEWLAAEAAVLPPSVSASVFTPPIVLQMGVGANIVDLTPLCKLQGCAGASMTFTATVLGQALKVTDLKVHATGPSGLHIVHPIFIGIDAKGIKHADPVDTLDGYDVFYPNAVIAPLGPGLILLTNVAMGDQVSLAFLLIERWDGVIQLGGCKSVALFTQYATPRLTYCANTCHGGVNPAAKAAVDMSHVTDPSMMGQTAACAQVLNRVNPGAPDQSQVFQVTMPGTTANHPYQVDVGTYPQFAADLTKWISSEK